MDPLIVAAIAAVTGTAGAVVTGWVQRRNARRLGLPTDTEQKIIDLRKELIDDLEREVERMEEAKDACLEALAEEIGKREQLEHRVDDLDIQNARLLRRLSRNGIEQ